MIRRAVVRMREVGVVVWRCPDAFACWLRHTYPQWAPQSGHVALVALCGQDGSLLEQKPRPAR